MTRQSPSGYSQLRSMEREAITRHLRKELAFFPWREQESLEWLIEGIENGKYEGAVEEEPVGILLTSMQERSDLRRHCDDGSIPGDIVLELLTDIETLITRMPFPIHNDDDHRIALAEMDRLWNSTLTPADSERLEILATLIDDYESKQWHAKEPNYARDLLREGHEEPCHVCGRRCDALAGDPGKWPIALVPPNGKPGVAIWHCTDCVQKGMRSAAAYRESLEHICGTAKLVELGKASRAELWNVIDETRDALDHEKVEAHGGCPYCGDGRDGHHAKVRKPEFENRNEDGPAEWYVPCPRSPEAPRVKSVLDEMTSEEREKLFKEASLVDEVSGGPDTIECERCSHGDPALDLFVCLPCAILDVSEERMAIVHYLRPKLSDPKAEVLLDRIANGYHRQAMTQGDSSKS